MKKSVLMFIVLFLLVAVVTSVSAQKCKVKIISTPPGATFSVNIPILKFGPTPMQFEFQKGKSYTIIFQKDGYKSKTIQYVANCKDLSVQLEKEGDATNILVPVEKPKTCILQIGSNVPGAEVYINNELSGKTPFSAMIEFGTYSILLSMEGYKDYTENVKISTPSYAMSVNLEMLTICSFQMISNVEGGKVYVNDAYSGDTPLTLKLEFGKYKIRVSKEDYTDFIETYNINTLNFSINANLDKERECKLQILSNIKNADVYIDDELKGNTPLNMRIDFDTYELRVSKEGYMDYIETIDVKTREMKIQANLESAVKINLTVLSNISGADVYLNDAKVGKTPLSIKQASGRYRLKVTLPGSGFEDFTTKLRLKKEDTVIEADLTAEDMILVELPLKSRLRVDDFWYDINWNSIDKKKQTTIVVTVYAPRQGKSQNHDLYIEYSDLVFSKNIRFNSQNEKPPVLKLGLSLEE